ncbi:MAG: ABC transporter ATP-binding protein [Marinilabiliales bacterium]|nr:MAG: ABC transporter ATP-binding protein [Marinilabiliales bacterium]
MFNLDIWQEIFHTLQKNKLRTFLTGFSIATGIFMLVLLLGVSRGIQNGAQQNFMDQAQNSINIYGGRTNLAYKGTNPGKYIGLKNSDFPVLETAIREGHSFAYETYIPAMEIISYRNNFGNFEIDPVSENFDELERIKMLEGRFINDADMKEKRKVVIVENKANKILNPKASLLGQEITINGIQFRVAGIFELSNFDFEEGGGRIFMPGTTAQALFGSPDHLTQIGFVVDDMSLEESLEVERKITRILAARHNFHPNDLNALWINNNIENSKEFRKVFNGIESAIWLIGIFTLILGVIGVFNIMMIIVRERTKEIGIRKAIGASPSEVIKLILTESIFITALSGYLGMVAGIGFLEVISRFDIISEISPNVAMFIVDPQVDMTIAVSATLVLVFFGTIAGYIPARRAAKIRPVVALRDE